MAFKKFIFDDQAKVIQTVGYRGSSGGGDGGSSFDADAQAFITAAGITDETQQEAIDTLVIGLKADSLWAKMRAIYPFVGGTADTHKYNLKDPRDLDAAFRLTWGGTTPHTHSANGIQPDGSTSFADTHLIENDVYGSPNSLHGSIYSRTNILESTYDYGALDGVIQSVMYTWTAGNRIWAKFGVTHAFKPNTGSLGCYIGSRVGASEIYAFVKGVRSSNYGSTTLGLATKSYYISGANNAPFPSELPSSRELAFVSFGTGLTDQEGQDLTTRVNTMQTSLSRGVH